MNKQKIVLSSLSLDLKRVAIGYFRGSTKMAERFFEESLKRKEEAQLLELKPYVKILLEKFEKVNSITDEKRKAEDFLMYATLFQNAALAS